MNIKVIYEYFDKEINNASLIIDEDKKINFEVKTEEIIEEVGEELEPIIETNKYMEIKSVDDSIGMELVAKLDSNKLDELILLLQRMKRSLIH